MVVKLITIATLKELIEESIMHMDSMLSLEKEGTFKFGVLNTFIENFKKDVAGALEVIETQGVKQGTLRTVYEETERIVKRFYRLVSKPEEDYEDDFLEHMADKVVYHKQFNKFFFEVQKELEKGEKDIVKMMKIVHDIAPDLEPYETNFAVCYVAEEIGVDMNTLINDFQF